MTIEMPQISAVQLNTLLADLNKKGGFPMAILTDQHGLPIAVAANPDQDTDSQAAVVAMIQKTGGQVRELLSMAQTDEISLYDTNGQRLVCRPFAANDNDLILAILVPDRQKSYRRLTNQVISAIQQQWQL